MSGSLIMSAFSASSALSSKPICGEVPLPVPAMAKRSGAEPDDDVCLNRHCLRDGENLLNPLVRGSIFHSTCDDFVTSSMISNNTMLNLYNHSNFYGFLAVCTESEYRVTLRGPKA